MSTADTPYAREKRTSLTHQEKTMLMMADVFRKLPKGEYAPHDVLMQRYTSRPDISSLTRLDITDEQGAVAPTVESVTAALNAVDFPINTSRVNTQKEGQDAQTSMCLGVVYSWRTSNTGFAGGAAGDNGVIASCHTQGRPNLSKLLARYCMVNRPGFPFTSIQVNKNYESALHCDKKNLGPSAIIGLGDYTDGKLWGEEFGAVDVKNTWFVFDGNMPHCTMPFGGTRYTLIYFINQGYEKVNLGDKNLISDLCKFPWPEDGLKKKRDYGTTPARLHIGKKAFEKWQKCVAEGTTYEYVFEDACSGAASKAGAEENKKRKKARERAKRLAAGEVVLGEKEEEEMEQAAKKLKQEQKKKEQAARRQVKKEQKDEEKRKKKLEEQGKHAAEDILGWRLSFAAASRQKPEGGAAAAAASAAAGVDAARAAALKALDVDTASAAASVDAARAAALAALDVDAASAASAAAGVDAASTTPDVDSASAASAAADGDSASAASAAADVDAVSAVSAATDSPGTIVRADKEYLVKWAGVDAKSWEPAANLLATAGSELLDKFEAQGTAPLEPAAAPPLGPEKPPPKKRKKAAATDDKAPNKKPKPAAAEGDAPDKKPPTQVATDDKAPKQAATDDKAPKQATDDKVPKQATDNKAPKQAADDKAPKQATDDKAPKQAAKKPAAKKPAAKKPAAKKQKQEPSAAAAAAATTAAAEVDPTATLLSSRPKRATKKVVIPEPPGKCLCACLCVCLCLCLCVCVVRRCTTSCLVSAAAQLSLRDFFVLTDRHADVPCAFVPACRVGWGSAAGLSERQKRRQGERKGQGQAAHAREAEGNAEGKAESQIGRWQEDTQEEMTSGQE